MRNVRGCRWDGVCERGRGRRGKEVWGRMGGGEVVSGVACVGGVEV